jgi:hypothetical protein
MAENQVYFVHAFRDDRVYENNFIATSESEAKRRMQEYLAGLLPKESDLELWQFDVKPQEDEKVLRALNKKQPL